MELGVVCVCNRHLSVGEGDFGSSLFCSCGRRVVVPLAEEFATRPLLLSAETLQWRVDRLISEGELPITDSCRCCNVTAKTKMAVDIWLDCQRSRTRVTGGFRFLILPFISMVWHEERRVEVRGSDVSVPVPICLCPECLQGLSAPKRLPYWIAAVVLLAVGATSIYFESWIGIGAVVAALLLLYLLRRRVSKRHQQKMKAILRKVPVYGQILNRYPRAVVVLPT